MASLTAAEITKLCESISFRRREGVWKRPADNAEALKMLRTLNRRLTEDMSDKYLISVWRFIDQAGTRDLPDYLSYYEREGLLDRAAVPAITPTVSLKMQSKPTEEMRLRSEKRQAANEAVERGAKLIDKLNEKSKLVDESRVAVGMGKILDYHIHEAKELGKLISLVKASIVAGWEPQGGLTFHRDDALLGRINFFQAMIKREGFRRN